MSLEMEVEMQDASIELAFETLFVAEKREGFFKKSDIISQSGRAFSGIASKRETEREGGREEQ